MANFGAGTETLELDVLDSQEATSFLLERTARRRRTAADDESLARDLAEELGRLALALEQAGVYIEHQTMSFAKPGKSAHLVRAKSGATSGAHQCAGTSNGQVPAPSFGLVGSAPCVEGSGPMVGIGLSKEAIGFNRPNGPK